MVRYVTMKRIAQLLASVLFIVTVLTVYLAFDFAINNAVSYENSPHKRSHPEHDHNHEDDDIKITKKRTTILPKLHQTRKNNQTRKHNQTRKYQNEDDNLDNNERHARDVKQKLSPHVKIGGLYKGKTGVNVKKLEKSPKDKRKRLSTSTKQSQQKNKHHLDDNEHV